MVLSRQWKNVIYTPILIEYNLKTSGMKNLYRQATQFIINYQLCEIPEENGSYCPKK